MKLQALFTLMIGAHITFADTIEDYDGLPEDMPSGTIKEVRSDSMVISVPDIDSDDVDAWMDRTVKFDELYTFSFDLLANSELIKE